MEQLIKMMKENVYVLEEGNSQLDYNIYTVMLLEKVLELDYTIPFEIF